MNFYRKSSLAISAFPSLRAKRSNLLLIVLLAHAFGVCRSQTLKFHKVIFPNSKGYYFNSVQPYYVDKRITFASFDTSKYYLIENFPDSILIDFQYKNALELIADFPKKVIASNYKPKFGDFIFQYFLNDLDWFYRAKKSDLSKAEIAILKSYK